MSVLLGLQRGHLDIFWLLWWGPYGSHGRALYRTAISDPSIKSCFSCSEERGQREGRGKSIQDSLGQDSETNKKASYQTCLITNAAISCLISIILWTDCYVIFISRSAWAWAKGDTQKTKQSILCRTRVPAITSVLCHNTKLHHW